MVVNWNVISVLEEWDADMIAKGQAEAKEQWGKLEIDITDVEY